MKEAFFIRQNASKWKLYEEKLKHISGCTPDDLADIYIDTTNDLSFARTHYPDSNITPYLNNISTRLHQYIHGRKRESFSTFVDFWKRKLPLTIYDARKELLYAFLVFFAGALIGAVSTANDSEFPGIILGDRYLDMTLENIEKGDPMAVYKDEQKMGMFLGITINNVKVSFNTFIAGILTSVATAWFLFTNGVMIGTFQYFFASHGLLRESFLTIWMHGTLEISAIIIAGAAGIAMGNGWLFPGTYSRIVSFRRGAKKGMRIVVGLVPVFVIAGFLESFLTGKTNLPDAVRLAVIIASLAFVLFYFVVWPAIVHKLYR
ncbi:MAG: stage II sporulation protein M [Dysgonamonadaceae bacterium]|jgi:uncharacterized membrane protein SpoIIM required for sporulation|nr:stage II sporulation protein M [Dysgonamonadaceae bacterium]